MFVIFDWGFRLALVLPWVAVIVGALTLLVPVPRREAPTTHVRAAA
jgi:hypothetical protein